MKVTVIQVVIGAFGMIPKKAGGVGNRRMSRDHPNYSIVEVGQNTEKSPEDLRRVSVTQIPVKYNQLTCGVKNLLGVT